MLAALGLCWAAMAAVMVALWLLQRSTANAGWVDVGWSAGVGACGAALAALAAGDPTRRLLYGSLIALWSARLAVYILRRLLSEPEDGRYLRLRREWGPAAQRKLFFFYQFQAPLAVAFALPVLVVGNDRGPGLGARDAVATLVWLVAVAGESIADRQLARFRSDPANRGRTCRVGLWRTSRHPNYFFEWLHWWTYPIAALGAPWWGVALLGPALMATFLLFVTGVPATEARAASSRPDYEEYRRTTSAFIPWFPKGS